MISTIKGVNIRATKCRTPLSAILFPAERFFYGNRNQASPVWMGERTAASVFGVAHNINQHI
jgi:hypothetical protein